ncbi:MAG: VOC family protein [Chloroflexota bacterium]|nr:VOC family protein [Rhodospirillaceae bacterium]MDE2958452.1 VOC family protein [Chloroflexota bacterium]
MQRISKVGALISIPVSSLRRSLTFYGDKLGFSLQLRDDRLGWAELESDSRAVRIGLAEVQEVKRGGPVLVIEVKDIEAAIKTLSELKVGASEITDVKNIARVATLEDPDRHLLMLRQSYQRRD